jgi:hypothetical protein
MPRAFGPRTSSTAGEDDFRSESIVKVCECRLLADQIVILRGLDGLLVVVR